MASDAVKLAKINNEAQIRRELMQLLTHPVYSMVAGFAVVGVLENVKMPNGQAVIGPVAGTTLQTALVSTQLAAALAKSGALESLIPGALALLK